MGVKNYIDQKGNLYFYLMPLIKYSPSHPVPLIPVIVNCSNGFNTSELRPSRVMRVQLEIQDPPFPCHPVAITTCEGSTPANSSSVLQCTPES